MFVCAPDEIIIFGTTNKEKVFRPSDWAERLCGILSSFDKGNRLSYHEWVRPILLGKVRSVAIAPQLAEINPGMYRFLMDFAADNDLQVLKGEDFDENGVKKAGCMQIENKAQHQVVENTYTPGELREIGKDEIARTFTVLSTLRPILQGVSLAEFEARVREQMAEGYRILAIFEEGKDDAVAVCAFREQSNLMSGRHLHIDDLITLPQSRKRGYAARLLNEVRKIAREKGLSELHIDSSVGGERTTAHRVYFQYGFEIDAYHFVYKVK